MKKIYYIAFLVINIILSISAMEIDKIDLSLDEKLVEFICNNKPIYEIKPLLEAGANINIQDEFGCTPLYKAAIRGFVDIVRILIKYGANINALNDLNQTLLHDPNIFRNKKIIKILIESGMSVNAKDVNGSTPLHMVAMEGEIEAAKYIIKKGADVGAVSGDGYTPLHYFCIVRGEWLINIKNIDAKGVELLTTAPMIFKNIQSVDLGKNKALLKKLDIFTFSYANKIFEWAKTLPIPVVESLVGFIFPLKDAIESRSIEKFVLKCYMNSHENLSNILIAQFYKLHLLTLTYYISMKNSYQQTALDLARTNNKNNIVTYFNKIYAAQRYEDLHQGLRDVIEKNYKDRLAPKDYFTNKETTLGMSLMNLKQLMEVASK